MLCNFLWCGAVVGKLSTPFVNVIIVPSPFKSTVTRHNNLGWHLFFISQHCHSVISLIAVLAFLFPSKIFSYCLCYRVTLCGKWEGNSFHSSGLRYFWAFWIWELVYFNNSGKCFSLFLVSPLFHIVTNFLLRAVLLIIYSNVYSSSLQLCLFCHWVFHFKSDTAGF